MSVDGAPAAKSMRVVRPARRSSFGEPADRAGGCRLPEIEVRFEDDDLAVVNKPAGLVVHPAGGSRGPTLVDALSRADGPCRTAPARTGRASSIGWTRAPPG